MTSSPISLRIDISAAKSSIKESLEARLQASPTKVKSPEDLSAASARAEALRTCYLEAVKDRAARESQRAEDAAARKRRLAATKADKVQRKLEAAFSHAVAKKEADDQERLAKISKRDALAAAVAEARLARQANIEARQKKLAELENTAHATHAKKVENTQAKAHSFVVHAAGVVEALKEKLEHDKVEAAEKIAAKMCRAELSRQERLSKDGPASPDSAAKLHAVLNNNKVTCETRRRSLDAAMAKATEKRAEILAAKVSSASKENEKAATVVANQLAKDTADPKAKKSLAAKMVNAEVARLTGLKNLVHKPKAEAVITIEADVPAGRVAPPALVARLSLCPGTLLATAASRQEWAKARRESAKAAAQAKVTKFAEKIAAATGKRAAAREAVVAKASGKATRADLAQANLKRKREAATALATRRTLAVQEKRAAAAAGLVTKGAANATKATDAAKRAFDSARKLGKVGAPAVRLAAVKARRDAATAATKTTGAKNAERGERATEKRAALLAARVTLAKKRMVALHPKREVAPYVVEEPSSEC